MAEGLQSISHNRADSQPEAATVAVETSAAGDGAARSVDDEAACPECGERLLGDYCHRCGEKRPDARELSMRHFAGDALKELTSLDSKLYHTLVGLLFRPGFLTLEWIAGRRSRYLKPFNLCLALFALQLFAYSASKQASMFDVEMLVQNQRKMAEKMHLPSEGDNDNIFQRAARRKSVSVESLEETVSEKWQRNVSLFQPVQILVLALLLQLFYLFSRRYFVEHLVFSMHFLAFATLTTTLMWPIYFVLGIAPTGYNMLVAGAKFLLDICYMFLALRAFYKGPPALAVLRALVLSIGYFITYAFSFMAALVAAMFAVLR